MIATTWYRPLGRGGRHAERRRDRGRRVGGAEDVVLGFRAVREAGEPAVLADRRRAVAPARQHLVRVRLVAHVPDEEVARGVEHVVQGHRQLDRAEARSEVSAGLRDRVDDEVRSSSASCGSWSGASRRKSRGRFTLSGGAWDGRAHAGFSRRSILRDGGAPHRLPRGPRAHPRMPPASSRRARSLRAKIHGS